MCSVHLLAKERKMHTTYTQIQHAHPNTMSAMPLRQNAAKKVNTALALLLENSWDESDCGEKVKVQTHVRG